MSTVQVKYIHFRVSDFFSYLILFYQIHSDLKFSSDFVAKTYLRLIKLRQKKSTKNIWFNETSKCATNGDATDRNLAIQKSFKLKNQFGYSNMYWTHHAIHPFRLCLRDGFDCCNRRLFSIFICRLHWYFSNKFQHICGRNWKYKIYARTRKMPKTGIYGHCQVHMTGKLLQ